MQIWSGFLIWADTLLSGAHTFSPKDEACVAGYQRFYELFSSTIPHQISTLHESNQFQQQKNVKSIPEEV